MRRLARALKINRAWAVGIMECLWHWAARFAPQGDIGRHSNEDIAEACCWEADPSVLVQTLIDCGWIEKDAKHRLVIHDWHDHCDQAVAKYISRNNLPFLSRNVRKCPDKDSLPEPVPEPEPVPNSQPEPAPKPKIACVSGVEKSKLAGQKSANGFTIQDLRTQLSILYSRPENFPWMCDEEHYLVDIFKRPDCQKELEAITAFKRRTEPRYFPNKLSRLLSDWTGVLDRARNGSRASIGPKHAEVLAMLREKFPGDHRIPNWSLSFCRAWEDKGWMRQGRPIDWKVELSKQTAAWARE